MQTFPPVAVMAITAALAMGVAGCSSTRGQPKALYPRAEAIKPIGFGAPYSRVTVLEAFYANDDSARGGLPRLNYRNKVAYIYLAASAANYNHFRGKLSGEMKGSTFGLNIGVLLLNGIAAVSGQDAANALAAGSAGLVGANTALGKDIFQQRTIDAVVTTMDAARTRQLTEIRRRLGSEDETAFPLGDVLDQIDQLEAKTSLYEAAGQIAAAAGAEKQKADAEAEVVPAYTVGLLPADVSTVRNQFAAYVRKLDDASKLGELKDALKAEPDERPERLKANIIKAYGERTKTKAGLNATSDLLKPVTQQDFRIP